MTKVQFLKTVGLLFNFLVAFEANQGVTLKSMGTISFEFHLGKLCRHRQVKETSWKMNNKSGDLMNSCMFLLDFS